ncbi:MAG: hypothetical protein ABIH90_01615 [Candidatus Aenigmatarchaeota archaeon]
MKLKLDCVFAETDSYGKVKKEVRSAHLAEIIDGTEVGGFSFEVAPKEGGVDVIVSGDGISDQVVPNYSGKIGSSVFQVGFKKESGKKTANALDMFLRRVNKTLSKTESGCNVLLIRDAEIVE